MFARKVRPWSADLLILAGQTALGQPGYPHHVAVVTQTADSDPMYDEPRGPKIVQAMPSGAEEIEIGQEHWTSDYTYLRPRYEYDVNEWSTQGRKVAAAARSYIGTPYSFADYAAIAGWRYKLRIHPIHDYVKSSHHMICSQLADRAMADAGFHVFSDERLPQDVTPSDLYRRLLTFPGTLVIKPS